MNARCFRKYLAAGLLMRPALCTSPLPPLEVCLGLRFGAPSAPLHWACLPGVVAVALPARHPPAVFLRGPISPK